MREIASRNIQKRFGDLLLFLWPRTQQEQQPHLVEMMMEQNKDFKWTELIRDEESRKVPLTVARRVSESEKQQKVATSCSLVDSI
jgi:hypothetical protein